MHHKHGLNLEDLKTLQKYSLTSLTFIRGVILPSLKEQNCDNKGYQKALCLIFDPAYFVHYPLVPVIGLEDAVRLGSIITRALLE